MTEVAIPLGNYASDGGKRPKPEEPYVRTTSAVP
jgi:hypothetical protein